MTDYGESLLCFVLLQAAGSRAFGVLSISFIDILAFIYIYIFTRTQVRLFVRP